jgi:hypothetical protein
VPDELVRDAVWQCFRTGSTEPARAAMSSVRDADALSWAVALFARERVETPSVRSSLGLVLALRHSIAGARFAEAFEHARAWSRVDRSTLDPRVELEGDSLVVLVHALAGPREETRARAQELVREARRLELPGVVVDATSSLALLALDDAPEEALSLARRAFRMARTEALPFPFFVSALVLARARRLTGRPYLASRILASLLDLAPASVHGWIGFEQAMASGVAALESGARGGPLGPVLRALERGERAELDRETDALLRRIGDARTFRADVLRLAEAVDASRPLSSGDLAAFRAGESDDVPFGLGGLGGDADEARVRAYALVRPGQPCVRIVPPGIALAERELGAVRFSLSQRKQGRIDQVLVLLAFAGEAGTNEEELFGRAYGFRYSTQRHKNTWNVLLHRARQLVHPHASLERDGDWKRSRGSAGSRSRCPRSILAESVHGHAGIARAQRGRCPALRRGRFHPVPRRQLRRARGLVPRRRHARQRAHHRPLLKRLTGHRARHRISWTVARSEDRDDADRRRSGRVRARALQRESMLRIARSASRFQLCDAGLVLRAICGALHAEQRVDAGASKSVSELLGFDCIRDERCERLAPGFF